MLSDNIRNYRKENNLSQDELAEKLGVSRQSISLWENGQTQPTVDNIIALAKIFNITADELLESYDGARTFQEAPGRSEKKERCADCGNIRYYGGSGYRSGILLVPP